MKKILFVITQFYKGGAEIALLNLLKSLSSKKYEVDFLIFDQVILRNVVSLVDQVLIGLIFMMRRQKGM